jgi:hypothetical protein
MTSSRVLLVVLIVMALVATIPTASNYRASSQQVVRNSILEYNAQVAMGRVAHSGKRQLVSQGALHAYMEAAGYLAAPAAAAATLARASASGTGGVTRRTLGCSNVFRGTFDNIKVNQDCSFRRQAEEFIVINPTNPNNLVAGQNDSVIGFNHCGIDFSFDRGRTWGSMVPPFWQFLQPDGHTSDAASDPAITFDSQGNAYFTCIIFNVATPASSIVVAKSNAQFGGSFFHSPAVLPFQEFRTVPLGVVASDSNPAVFHDKEFINADRGLASPKRDIVYITWTRFTLTNSPIYFSQSTDGGATWSPGVEISGANAALCTFGSGGPDPNACDQDQGSWPFSGPDGTIHVVFANGNTPLFGINQILMVKCPPANNCALAASWSAPVKVADLIGTHPIAFAPNAAGCPVGRQCLPPNGYRVPEVTSITGLIDPTSPNRLFVTWADFRNGAAPCNTLNFATSTPPCDNDVFIVWSTNGGATWSAAKRISHTGTAQWQPWSAIGPEGRLYVAYYDRRYGDCEFSGCNDITLAVSHNAGATFQYFRITTKSMPNLVVANNPLQAGFLGDYMGIDADKHGAVLVWGDTRGRNDTVEEDIYFARWPR